MHLEGTVEGHRLDLYPGDLIVLQLCEYAIQDAVSTSDSCACRWCASCRNHLGRPLPFAALVGHDDETHSHTALVRLTGPGRSANVLVSGTAIR